MDDKKCFLEKLFELFHVYGAKTLTMDDIAKEFSISKKTLYQKYKHKEDLICDVLDFISDEGLDEIEKVREEYDCPIESLLVSGARMDEITCKQKNIFVIQLLKYYPDIFHSHQVSVSVRIIKILREDFEKGIKLGYFREDIPIDLYIKFLITLFFSTDISPIFTEETDKKSLSVAMKLLYLDAIVTDEGKQRLNELKEKYQYNNI
ncbi:TetR/AcrR family transcriptional regulator [Cloacibacterium sp.]|uniref:TetR/AcrR family transcriptional regulator n=1 Tax=Cloacibacterium sp. TaxID=1913682 RepID=UPI0039E30F69